MFLKLLTSPYVEKLKRRAASGFDVGLYMKSGFELDSKNILGNPDIEFPSLIAFKMPDNDGFHDFENSKILFEALKKMNPTQATDYRIWTYLTHATFWDYMRKRSPVENQPEEERAEYVLTHWFVNGINTMDLMRNNISSLWWCAYLTYDETRKDQYELTREVFTMLDYTRNLLPGTQGRNKNFTHALLEFVIENKELFSTFKESKVRFLMRKSNFIAGYKLMLNLSKEEIKKIFESYKNDLINIK
ncbi:MAG: DUF6339 family protein [Patescibacteria group bacterium]